MGTYLLPNVIGMFPASPTDYVGLLARFLTFRSCPFDQVCHLRRYVDHVVSSHYGEAVTVDYLVVLQLLGILENKVHVRIETVKEARTEDVQNALKDLITLYEVWEKPDRVERYRLQLSDEM